MTVRLSITLSALDAATPAQLGDLGRAADEAGLDTVWVPDHLMEVAPGRPRTDPVLEAHTILGHLAAVTRRVRLGALVANVTLRPAALLVKAVTTLDVLSGGRAWFGVGVGYQRDEAEALGLPLPPTPERFALLDETLDLARRMWSGDRSPVAGDHLRLADPVAAPAPVTRPHPPILVGGTGPRRTLPLVARRADAANLFDVPDGGDTLRRALDRLDECCAAIGRDPASLARTAVTRVEPDEGADATVTRCLHLGRLGLDHVILMRDAPWTPGAVAALGEVRAALDATGQVF